MCTKSQPKFVRITAKGVKETLGKGKRFQNLPKIFKQQKIATLRYLPEIIKNGTVVSDDVPNFHGETALFAYIVSHLMVNDMDCRVKVAIKKRVGDNIFWIHSIDCNEKALNYSTSVPLGLAIKEI